MKANDIQDILRRGLAEYGLSERAGTLAVQQMNTYCQSLLEKNREMNLTAITDPTDVANLHMLDCAALLKYADPEGRSLIDVGTGAGFPGMVLKMLVPSLELTLLDALNKRLNFLLEVCGDAGLQGVRAVHGRAEELGQNAGFREQFDFATARAVAALRVLCELCLPFVKVGGQFLAMKGTESQEELDGAAGAVRTLGGQVKRCFDYSIPGTVVRHRVVVVEKISPTPPKFPRRWAKIQKSPI